MTRKVVKAKKIPPHPRRKTAVQVSPYITIRKSGIHNKGVFAKKDIPKGVRLLEYIGRYITKNESDEIVDKHWDSHRKNNNNGAVYVFELNKHWDIDGNVPENTARLIIHSCNPNSDAKFVGDHIWITSIKSIKKGEEITYDYGYDLEEWEDHPCKCGSKNCLGYIVSEKHMPKLKRILKNLMKKGKRPK